jgi:hypothetical protein
MRNRNDPIFLTPTPQEQPPSPPRKSYIGTKFRHTHTNKKTKKIIILSHQFILL